MALLHCNFQSHVLQLAVSMDVILPQNPHDEKTGLPLPYVGKHPVLYLLHGLSDDHTIWQRRTSIERYVEGRDLAVVMPAVDRSWYTDMEHGNRYWTYISEELPMIVRGMFPISDKREDTYVAGLSMGGYGAFKLALSHPERFAAAASFSGALDMATRMEDRDEDWQAELYRVFGKPEAMPGSPKDLFALAQQVALAGNSPMLYQWCGVEDFLYEMNGRFREHALALGLNLTYAEGPGGHTWDRWDIQIARFLDMLPLK